ncbi:MAG TPA: alpha/beta hydrolase [Syntrophales bacterium]|nr:alpha/beta hydrolase [Syntrophales bacterium]
MTPPCAVLWVFVRAALWVFVPLVFFFFILYLFQGRFVFFPTAAMEGSPADRGLSFEDIHFTAADGTPLSGWFVPGGREGPPQGTVLFCHGNAGNISHRVESILLFHEMDLDVFIFDYRGYGGSAGKPSEEGTTRDAEGAWRYLTERRSIPPERIVLFGRSLGGSVAACLAAKTAPAGLIVESAFTSIPDLAAHLYPYLPMRPILKLRFPTRNCLQRVSCPVLVIHSRDDEIIPFRHGKALYEAAAGPKRFLEIGGGHNDGFFLSENVYREGLKEFFLFLREKGSFGTKTGTEP